MIQLCFVLLCFFSSTFAESGEVLGSRVITNSSEKVGPMYFKLVDDPRMYLHKVGSEDYEELTFEDGECIVGGKIVGSPCDVLK
ncbi:unnamed protein product, partial [Hymenolepis diminuta]